MKELNAKYRSLKQTGKRLFAAVLIFIISLFLPQDGIAQIEKKNGIAFGYQFNKHYNSGHLQYQRVLTKRWSLIGTWGSEKWKEGVNKVTINDPMGVGKVIEGISRANISVRSRTFGLGTEYSLRDKPGGFFVQGNILYRKVKWLGYANAEIVKTGSGSINFPLGLFLFGIWGLGGGNRDYGNLKYEEITHGFGLDGKFGYKLISNNEKHSLVFFLGLETIPGDGKDKNFITDYHDYSASFNPSEVIGRIGMHFGLQWIRLF